MSDERIDTAPAPLRALFRDFEFWQVVQALQAVGLNDDPARFSDIVIQAGAEEARKILQAEARKRTEDLLGGP